MYYIELYTYINVCTYMHSHGKQLHPVCSWSGHRPDYNAKNIGFTDPYST